MALAWTCTKEPTRHGTFPQTGLDTLSAIHGAPQPRDRFACPVCIAKGDYGAVRPATDDEIQGSG